MSLAPVGDRKDINYPSWNVHSLHSSSVTTVPPPPSPVWWNGVRGYLKMESLSNPVSPGRMADTTNLPCIKDIITRRRNSLFGHVVRLDDHTPAHRALSEIAAIRTGSCHSGWGRWTQLVASSNRRHHTFWHLHRVDQGSPSWTHRDWVDVTDLCVYVIWWWWWWWWWWPINWRVCVSLRNRTQH